MSSLDAECVNVANARDTSTRWTEAMGYYSHNIEETTVRHGGRVAIKAAIDVSSSMSGSKLIAVKLGLCAILSQLQDSDLMHITSFSTVLRRITNGFVPVSSLRQVFPTLLENIYADGATACYDAALDGMADLSDLLQEQEVSRVPSSIETDSDQRNVFILLTDGEDNSSNHSAESVCAALAEPGFDNFMFILVAVEMKAADERIFQPWVSMRHCKQVSVSVRTGAMLVKVFKEVLMSRVLQTASDSSRLYHRQHVATLATAEDGNIVDLSSSLSAHLILSRDLEHSPAVSRCNSVSHLSDRGSDDGYMLRHGNWRALDSDIEDAPLVVDEIDAMMGSNHAKKYRRRSDSGSFFSVFNIQRAADTPSITSGTSASSPSMDSSDTIPTEFRCPITMDIMRDPVMCADGHTYDRIAIESWLLTHDTSPLTNKTLPHTHLLPNHALRNLIQSSAPWHMPKSK